MATQASTSPLADGFVYRASGERGGDALADQALQHLALGKRAGLHPLLAAGAQLEEQLGRAHARHEGAQEPAKVVREGCVFQDVSLLKA